MADKNQQRLIFSVLQYISGVAEAAPEGVDVESLEVAVQCLGQAFSLDVTDEEQTKEFAIGSSLDQIFKYGLVLDASEDTPITNLLKQAVDTVEKTQGLKPSISRDEKIFNEKFEKYIQSLAEKGFFTGTEEGSPEYEERVEKARKRLKEEEEKAAAARKEQAEVKKGEGNTFLREGKTEEAIEKYTEAINLDPYNAIYYANRAAAFTSLRQHENAIEDCQKAVTIDPQYSKAFSRMGLAFFSLGRYHEAVHAYERAKQLDPENASILQSLDIAQKKNAETSGEAGGHSHGGAACNHSHGAAGGAAPPAGMPDLAGLMNNPGIQSMMANMAGGAGAGGAGGAGGMPNVGEMLNNPEMLSQATQMLNNPGVSNLLSNPAIMNMASQMMQNPDMMGSMLSNFGNMAGMMGGNKGGEAPKKDE